MEDAPPVTKPPVSKH